MTILVCPACSKASRTSRELRPAAKVRCGECKAVSRCFIHGNGAVELRADVPPPIGPGPPPLPPRVDGGERPVVPRRRIERPTGGYIAFERSRSWIGMMAGWTVAGLALIAGYWYFDQINALGNARGRTGANFWAQQDAARRGEFHARQRKAMEAQRTKMKGKSQ